MITNILIKTDSKLRDEAKSLAEEFGMSLTAVVNASLKQFVRDRRLELVSYPKVKASKLRQWAKDRKDMDEHPEKYKIFHSVAELTKDLER